eukprot:TRINITY_DN11515_c0_g1_i1.p2 TRINITY_DN11515_c0_g1~~TRINITY_DN11515_c0_g1_i1.p2  ORF type:complete len:111 (+),score=29.04 TRINITY_DN11515_c0_g1_i1:35-367(+)
MSSKKQRSSSSSSSSEKASDRDLTPFERPQQRQARPPKSSSLSGKPTRSRSSGLGVASTVSITKAEAKRKHEDIKKKTDQRAARKLTRMKEMSKQKKEKKKEPVESSVEK